MDQLPEIQMAKKTIFTIGRLWLAVFLGLLFVFIIRSAVAKEDQDMSLKISIPMHNSERTIQIGKQATPFQVRIENVSSDQINLWRESNSWGYFNLKFQIVDKDGHTWTVRKKEIVWEKNSPSFISLEPGGKMVIDVTLDPVIWENVLLPHTETLTNFSMTAVYESENSNAASERNIWSGRVVSDDKNYTFLQQND